MIWILIVVSLVTLWTISLYKIRVSSSTSVPPNPKFLYSNVGKKRNVLLVVAHPDDESMFFAPTILFLASEGHILHILCLSTGNADGKGSIRKKEMHQACAILKVPPKLVKILDHPDLQDGFGNSWDHKLIADIVEEEIKLHNIDLLITFDAYGVSGHQNHRDVHHGTSMVLRKNPGSDLQAWELVSTSILRKYIGPVDIWFSTFSSSDKERTYSLINTNPGISYLAMAAHYSQWIWFRKLFVSFSSYTYMNTLRKISV